MTGERRNLSPVQKLVISEALIVLVIAFSLVVFSVLDAQKPEVEQKETETARLNVDVYAVVPTDFQELLTGFGTVLADREVILAAQVSGEIVDINPQLKVGEFVAARTVVTSSKQPSMSRIGELLLKIDPRDYVQHVEQAANRIAEAETEIQQLSVQQTNVARQLEKAASVLATLKEEYDRIQLAVTRKAASGSDLNRALLEVQRYEDTVIQLESQAATIPFQKTAAMQRLLTSKSEEERAGNDLEKTEVRPPFSGVLSEVFVEKGQYLRAGEPLVRLTDLTQVEIPISLSFDDFTQMEKDLTSGRKLAVSLAENETAAVRWKGFVVRAAPEADTVSRTVQVFVEVHNTGEKPPLLPGAFVHSRIDGRIYEDEILIPREAIIDGQVYLIDGNNVARRRKIKAGRRLQSMVVVEDGLDSGDQIVITNLDIVEEGREVVVQTVSGLADEIALLRSPRIRMLTQPAQ